MFRRTRSWQHCRHFRFVFTIIPATSFSSFAATVAVMLEMSQRGLYSTMSDYERWLGSVQIAPVLVPHDCGARLLYANWRQPAACLDTYIRSGSSSFWAIGNAAAGLQNLRRDLETGKWERRYAELLTHDEYDAGYRLVVAD